MDTYGDVVVAGFVLKTGYLSSDKSYFWAVVVFN